MSGIEPLHKVATGMPNPLRAARDGRRQAVLAAPCLLTFSTLEGPVRAALQEWADYVARITGQANPASNVVEMKQKA